MRMRIMQGSESRQETVMPTPVRTANSNNKNNKTRTDRITKITPWNTRTMYDAGKAAQVAREMETELQDFPDRSSES